MTTTATTAELPKLPTSSRFWPRLVRADFLKLRKRRGLVLASVALTVGPMLVAYGVLTWLHGSDPAQHGPAGGIANFTQAVAILGKLGAIAAVLVGVTAGAGDLGAGVFRELVVTGRSRLQLFLARIPAGLALLLALVAVAYAVPATASVTLAAADEAPDAGLLLHTGGVVVLGTAVSFALALGVASVIGSRAIAIALLLGWQLAVSPLLLALSQLGSLRVAVLDAAIERLAPEKLFVQPSIAMSATGAAIVVAAWVVVPLAFGAWGTSTREA
ncbi:MAG: hypothetical protein M3168_06545 [Actinomycetota bacterium]|nr:hypothetical protein [Actinomycetota bacterium]